jgi:hypothetical protein
MKNILEDKWLGNYTFKKQYPLLWEKSDTMQSFLSILPLSVSFRSSCHKIIWYYGLTWYGELCMCNWITRNMCSFRTYIQHGEFNVHSLCLSLINNRMANRNKELWRLKVPLKIKIFMWYMYKKVVMTKDNLAK